MKYRTFFHRNISTLVAGIQAPEKEKLQNEIDALTKELSQLKFFNLEVATPPNENFDLTACTFVGEDLKKGLIALGIEKISQFRKVAWSEEGRIILSHILKKENESISNADPADLKKIHDTIGLIHINGISNVYANILSTKVASLKNLAELNDADIEKIIMPILKDAKVNIQEVREWRDQAMQLIGLETLREKKPKKQDIKKGSPKAKSVSP